MKVMGCDLRWRNPNALNCVEDYRKAARGKLPPMAWTYVESGAEDMVTLHDNRAGFSNWNLRTRSLVGHGKPDLSTTIAGVKLKLPVLLAPTGYTGLSHWRGDIDTVRAAERNGTRYVLSTSASWSIEEVANAASEEPIFQLYPSQGDMAAKMMARAWVAGYRTLFLTVDVPVPGNRETWGQHVLMTPKRFMQTALHPRWVYHALRHQRLGGRNIIAGGTLADALKAFAIQTRELMQSTLNWEDVAWVRDQWKGKVYIKGLLDPEDAQRAVALGADGIVVSNHGGRQLDFAGSTIGALPGIAQAVGGRAEILLDSGVRRGTDVIKALALGANAVMVGRPYLYGLAVAGGAGVSHILEIFRSEMERALTLMGVPNVQSLDPTSLLPRDNPHSPAPD